MPLPAAARIATVPVRMDSTSSPLPAVVLTLVAALAELAWPSSTGWPFAAAADPGRARLDPTAPATAPAAANRIDRRDCGAGSGTCASVSVRAPLSLARLVMA